MEASIWVKESRIIFFVSIYQDIFWNDIGLVSFYPDWENISEIFESPLLPSDREVFDSTYLLFSLHKHDLINKLKLFLTSWGKTHLVIQACLLCALMEFSNQQKQESPRASLDNLLAPYLRIADNFDSGSSVGVVYAVLSKFIESSVDYTSLPKS